MLLTSGQVHSRIDDHLPVAQVRSDGGQHPRPHPEPVQVEVKRVKPHLHVRNIPILSRLISKRQTERTS